jgi:hypothetical protein
VTVGWCFYCLAVCGNAFEVLCCPLLLLLLLDLLLQGATGSQLDGTQDGSAGSCNAFSSPRVVYPDASWMKNLQCFAHMMSVRYDNNTGR